MQAVLDRLLERLEKDDLDREKAYCFHLALYHEDMHDEAFTYARQTLGYPAPRFPAADPGPIPAGGKLAGDAAVEGGAFVLGSTAAAPFAFDNEVQAHTVQLRPFAIARAPVTEAEFHAFVEDGGYSRPELWDAEGRRWLETAAARGEARPLYWRREPGGGWLCRRFDRWTPLQEHLPMLHVNWHEAQAYCRWAGRRLPTEAEWELAASGGAAGAGKRAYPWGEVPPGDAHANLDWRAAGAPGGGLVDVGALPSSDSPHGCRQMLGNVWEWTATEFTGYPGFQPDPYREFSQPWFSGHRVLRGGCFATRARLVHNRFRNFYTPERNDVFAGFRTARSLQDRPNT
jgi:iron(II)-dependent oxidoreductase